MKLFSLSLIELGKMYLIHGKSLIRVIYALFLSKLINSSDIWQFVEMKWNEIEIKDRYSSNFNTFEKYGYCFTKPSFHFETHVKQLWMVFVERMNGIKSPRSYRLSKDYLRLTLHLCQKKLGTTDTLLNQQACLAILSNVICVKCFL